MGVDKVTKANGGKASKGVVNTVNIGPVFLDMVKDKRWQHYEDADTRHDNQENMLHDPLAFAPSELFDLKEKLQDLRTYVESLNQVV